MILRNKKTGKFETVTHEVWEKLKIMGFQRKFEVVDSTDSDVTDVIIPQEVKDFMEQLHQEIEPEPKEVEEPKEPEETDIAHDDEGTHKRRTKKIKHD